MPVPENAKKPQDRKDKTKPAYAEGDLFTFTVGDEEQKLTDPADVITPGFFRKNRAADPVEITYQALEMLATEEQLDAIDNMTWTQNRDLLKAFDAYIGGFFKVSLGE